MSQLVIYGLNPRKRKKKKTTVRRARRSGARSTTVKRKQKPRARRNPGQRATRGAQLFGYNVAEIRYQHVSDRKHYKHPFTSQGFLLEALKDGSIRIYHPDGVSAWEDL